MPRRREIYVKKAYRFLGSVKLAIILILFIAAASLLSTLVPQGRPPDFYRETWPPFLSVVILFFGYDRFFSSWLFLIPSFLFFVNLLLCTLRRLASELKKQTRRRYGPDILHIGLLILIVGGTVTYMGNRTGYIALAEGDTVVMPGGFTLVLESFEFLIYSDGRPKDWISTVHVSKDGRTLIDSYPIEVNKPLKVGGLNIYQYSYSMEGKIMTTFKVVSDPGFTPVLIGLLCLTAGLFITYFQKMKDSVK